MKVSLGEGILKMFALFAFVFPDPIRDYDGTIFLRRYSFLLEILHFCL